MKQRQRKRQRAWTPTAGCQPVLENSVGSLDEGLIETFPASDPVSVSVTRIEESGETCGKRDESRSG